MTAEPYSFGKEQEVRILNRSLRAISRCNQLILHSSEEQEILDGVCRILVQECGHALAWVGYPEPDQRKSVRIMALAGSSGYVPVLTWADEPNGRGPAGTALRTGETCECSDCATDPKFAPWAEAAMQHGLRSVIIIPFNSSETFGCLSIYSPIPKGFSEEEKKLLAEMAQNVAFGITALRTRAERERAEQQLRASEERYRSLVLATAQVVFTTDADGLVTREVPSWCEYTGATFEEVRGCGWVNAVHPEDREAAAEGWADAVRTRTLYQAEYRLRRKDGEYRRMSARGVPVMEADGQTIREWVGACTDITERKQAEERLREQAALLDLAPAAIFVRDADSRITYWSRGAEEIYGFCKEEALGKFSKDLLCTEFPTALARIEAEVVRGAWEGELVHTARNGKQMTIATRWAPQRNSKGEIVGFLEINVDITGRKEAEQELQRYMKELERSNRELQDFASIASHDLQEPLRKVLAFGDHLREHCKGKLDDLGLDFLSRMQNAAQRMSVLIEALLAFSRVATKAQPLHSVDTMAVMFGVLVDLEDRIARTHAKIEFGLLPRVKADSLQLRQVIQNLVANALKFQKPNSTPHIVIEGRQVDSHWCELTVRDNGIGFDEKYLDRIFRPFQRLHDRSEYEGCGMGLAICRKVVERHGGAITAHSRPGEGSTFVVTLPPALAAPQVIEEGRTHGQQ